MSSAELKDFFYFFNNSTSKEPIHSVKAHTWQEAVNIFASLKNLSFHDFLEIFSVEEKV